MRHVTATTRLRIVITDHLGDRACHHFPLSTTMSEGSREVEMISINGEPVGGWFQRRRLSRMAATLTLWERVPLLPVASRTFSLIPLKFFVRYVHCVNIAQCRLSLRNDDEEITIVARKSWRRRVPTDDADDGWL